MWERFATGASSYAQSVDHLILLIAVLVGFWFILAEGIFFWLIFKYRSRDGQSSLYVSDEQKELRRWISVPHWLVIACDVLIIVAAVRVWVDIKQAMPPVDETIRVYMQQYSMSFQEAGADGILDTADDIKTVGELHVKVNTTYKFELRSRDVVHSFSIPSFRLKQDAVPGRTIVGWFRPTRLGTYDIQCSQMCGVGHALMASRIIVETPEQHTAWITQSTDPALLAKTTPSD